MPSLSESWFWSACSFSESSSADLVAEEGVTVLNLLRASETAPGLVALVEVGRDVGREAVVDVRVAEVEVVAGLVAGLAVVEETMLLGRDVVVFRSAIEPTTLDLRSKVDVVGFAGARVEGVPASDMRLAVPEIPFFSSLELKRDFSSAELLTDARERWEAVVAELRVLRVVVEEVVVGRVGGLFSVLPLVEVRAEAVVLLEGEVMEVGRLVVGVDPDRGRLVVVVVEVEEAVLVGDDGLTFSLEFSLSLPPSGLVIGSSLPDMTEESTGVAGGGTFSVSVSVAGGEATGSSVEAMVF